MKRVHVLGNSHVMYFVGRPVAADTEVVQTLGIDFEVRAFKAGDTGATIWGLPNKDSETGAGDKFVNYVQDSEHPIENLVMVLGDVDFREHMIPRTEKNDPKKWMEELMGIYHDYMVNRLLPLCPDIKEVVLFEMVPFSRGFYESRIKEDLRNGSLFFFHEKFNECVRKLATDRGWKTISLSNYSHWVSDSGFLPSFLLQDPENFQNMHLNPKTAIWDIERELWRTLG